MFEGEEFAGTKTCCIVMSFIIVVSILFILIMKK